MKIKSINYPLARYILLRVRSIYFSKFKYDLFDGRTYNGVLFRILREMAPSPCPHFPPSHILWKVG